MTPSFNSDQVWLSLKAIHINQNLGFQSVIEGRHHLPLIFAFCTLSLSIAPRKPNHRHRAQTNISPIDLAITEDENMHSNGNWYS